MNKRELEQSVKEAETVINNPSTEEAVSMAVNSLNTPKKINTGTDLSHDEIKLLCALEGESTIYKDDILKTICLTYKELKVSHKRQGRKEIIETIKAMGMNNYMNGNGGIIEGLKGIMGGRR